MAKKKPIKSEYDFFMALKERPEKFRKMEWLYIATILEAYDYGITKKAFEKYNVQIMLTPFNGKDRVWCVIADDKIYDLAGLWEMFDDIYKHENGEDEEFTSVYKYFGRNLDVPMMTSSLACAYSNVF